MTPYCLSLALPTLFSPHKSGLFVARTTESAYVLKSPDFSHFCQNYLLYGLTSFLHCFLEKGN
jgi:hypothetical protein